MFQNSFNTKTKITKQQSTLTLKYYLPTVFLIILSIVNIFNKGQPASNIWATASGINLHDNHPYNIELTKGQPRVL